MEEVEALPLTALLSRWPNFVFFVFFFVRLLIKIASGKLAVSDSLFNARAKVVVQ